MSKTPELVDDDNDEPILGDDDWTVEVEGTPYRFPLLAKFGIALGMLALLFVASLALVPMVLPASATITYAENLIGRIVGTDVEIKGDHSIRILPSLRLEAANVVSAQHGQDGQDGQGGRGGQENRAAKAVHLQLPHLEIEMSALGALAGSVDIDRIAVRNPVLRIQTGEDGGMAAGKAGAAPDIDRAWGWWRDMAVHDLQVENAAFVLADSRSGRMLKLEGFSIKKAEDSQDRVPDGLVLRGAGSLNGREIGVEIVTADPQLLVSGNRWPFEVSLSSALLQGSFEGSMAVRERTVGEGNLVLTGDDVVALNAWIGPFLPARRTAPLNLKASLDVAGDTWDVRRLELDFGATSLGGQVTVSGVTSGAPRIDGRIDAAVIDFGLAGAEDAMNVAEAPLMIPGMPSGRIGLNWQNAMWQGLAFGAGGTVIERLPETRKLTVSLDEMSAYGGVMRADVTLDASEGLRALSVEGRAIGVDIGPLLGVGTTRDDPPLVGRSTIELSLFSVGGSSHELIQALTGTAEVVAQNGQLMISELVSGLVPEAGERLPFKTLNANFRIAQGIAASDDLLLRAGDLSLVGKGRIDLANWTIDLNVGRLGTDGDARSLRRYRVSGPASDMRVEPVNGS